jgi:hypothetical protein
MKLGRAAAIGVLLAETACQLVVDVSDYRFDDADAGGALSELEPRPSSAAFHAALDAGAAATAMDPVIEESGDEAAAPAEETPEPEPSPPTPSEPSPEPEASPPAPPEPPPPDPVNGCSIIEFCYAHQVQNTTDEERCIQRGCSLDAAIAECRAEIAVRCGSAPRPPYVMITQAGERVILD